MSEIGKLQTVDAVIKEHVLKVLEEVNWNRDLAIEILGIGARTLAMWLRAWGYPPRYKARSRKGQKEGNG